MMQPRDDIMKLYTIDQQKRAQLMSQASIVEWHTYWKEQGQPWRKEPEIPKARQEFLQYRRSITPDIHKGIYPFGGIQLTRADVEWLLATHDHGQGPVIHGDEQQLQRQGLDLRGAQLQEVNLNALPLTNLIGGLTDEEHRDLSEKQRSKAVLSLKKADLVDSYLDGALLLGAHLDEADVRNADLVGANLRYASMIKTDFNGAVMIGADLALANLERAYLNGTYLISADLGRASLEEAYLNRARLENTYLDGSRLNNVEIDSGTSFVFEGVGPALADVSWENTHLSVIDWSKMKMIGEEHTARQKVNGNKKPKDLATRLKEYTNATRATYQFATVLYEQGIKTDAARFEYRAKCLERIVRFYELRTIDWYEKPAKTQGLGVLYEGDLYKEDGKNSMQDNKSFTVSSISNGLKAFFTHLIVYLFSWFLFLIAGYGYRLRNCLLWYIVIIGLFAYIYWLHAPTLFSWQTALGESMAVFHGRGTTLVEVDKGINLNSFALWTVVEAFSGLIFEVVLVATAIQRFFGK